MTTSQLITHINSVKDEEQSSFDAQLSLANGAFTRHRFSYACHDELQPDTGKSGVWHLHYSDSHEEYIHDETLLKWYPDALGDIWAVEED